MLGPAEAIIIFGIPTAIGYGIYRLVHHFTKTGD